MIINIGSDDEGADSSMILADLAAMFPAVDHGELVTILRSHGGDLDATVDYLMALSLHTEIGGGMDVVHQGLEQDDQSYGQFSDEIGGLPSIMSCDQTDSDSDEDGVTPVNHGGNAAKEGLPSSSTSSHEGAMRREGEGDGYVVAGCIMLPVERGETEGTIVDGKGSPATLPQLKQPQPHKKHSEFLLYSTWQSVEANCNLYCYVTERPKKLRKLAGKLNVKKNVDYKAEQERRIAEPAYQPLLPPHANGESINRACHDHAVYYNKLII